MTVNLTLRKASVTDLIQIIFYPEQLFVREESQVLQRIGNDNKYLHLSFGLDNGEYVTWMFNGWIIEGIPDQVDTVNHVVIEGKVARENSNILLLASTAYIQAFIYAKALEYPYFKVVVFKPDRTVVFEKVFETENEEPKIRPLLERAISVLELIKSCRDRGQHVKQLMEQEVLA